MTSRGTAVNDDREPGVPGVLDKALTVLEVFTEGRPNWTVSEVAREVALPFSTAQRILRALEKHALLERVNGRAYRLGMGAIQLGRRARAAFDLVGILAPALRQLWRETDETSDLSIVDLPRLAARCIDRVEGGYPFRLSRDLETFTPLHAGATSKVLLAHLDAESRERVLAGPLTACASATITDPGRLREQLELVRAQGYAFDEHEFIDGAWGMAAPILVDGALVASIGFIAPTIRLDPEYIERGAAYVQQAAARAAELLRAKERS